MSEQINILELAKQYIRLRRFKVEGVKYLIHYRKKFWKYSDGKWSGVSWESMINDMIKLVDESDEFHSDSNPGLMSNVLRTVQALVEVENLDRGKYINQEPECIRHSKTESSGTVRVRV